MPKLLSESMEGELLSPSGIPGHLEPLRMYVNRIRSEQLGSPMERAEGESRIKMVSKQALVSWLRASGDYLKRPERLGD